MACELLVLRPVQNDDGTVDIFQTVIFLELVLFQVLVTVVVRCIVGVGDKEDRSILGRLDIILRTF